MANDINETSTPNTDSVVGTQIYKIYNQEQFDWITRGIKIAQCMQSYYMQSSYIPNNEEILCQLEDLVVSDALCCSFCNTAFEDKVQQRLHYKLDWHRYNLKQHLNDLKSISEDHFNLLADEGRVSSLSGSEIESENEEDSSNEQAKPELGNKNGITNSSKSRKGEKRGRGIEFPSNASDTECNEKMAKKKKQEALSAIASRHTKVFFENEDKNVFSIYRCLLHHKKDTPEVENEMITQALNSGKNTTWTIIMVGGGHFAAAVYQGDKPIKHKTFHTYTVRAKQGFTQSSRSGNYSKSAGANLRKHNEDSLAQHVQEILESWLTDIQKSSLILYRAVGTRNRTILFGGKNPPLDKNDIRLRGVPFPTRRATFSEVKRVHDILSTMEIHGPAANFIDCYPRSPRQPVRTKISKTALNKISRKNDNAECDHDSTNSLPEKEKIKAPTEFFLEGQYNDLHSDIITESGHHSSGSGLDESEGTALSNILLIAEDVQIDLKDNLLAFENTTPRYMKNKRLRRQKKKEKKNSQIINEVLSNAKLKLWSACKSGDNDLLSSIINDLLTEIKKCEQLEESNKDYITVESNNFVNMDDMRKLINDTDEDGNTMLHLAAFAGHLKLVWLLLETGCDPCKKNKKLQTPYATTDDKETRNTFRRFMGAYPNKFNYQKSQIPGPLTDEIEQEELDKKRQQRKVKRAKEKFKKKEFELKKREENEKQKFLSLSDKQKRVLTAEKSVFGQQHITISRCFQCAVDMTGLVPFEYNANLFCSMPCLKEHRLHNKFTI